MKESHKAWTPGAGVWPPSHKRFSPTSAQPPPPFLCLLQDAGSQQVGFLLGSCGVTLALTTDACQKGLPKAPTGEVATFKGEAPRSQFWLFSSYAFTWLCLLGMLCQKLCRRGCWVFRGTHTCPGFCLIPCTCYAPCSSV